MLLKNDTKGAGPGTLGLPKALAVLVLSGIAIGLAGCAGLSEQSVYEGLRSKRNTDAAGTVPPPPPMSSYDRYKKEREEAR